MTGPHHDDLHDNLDLVAAEYVLGTLESEAVQAFEQRLATDGQARVARRSWETHFASLGASLAPVSPPPAVWSRIREQAGLSIPALQKPRSPAAHRDHPHLPDAETAYAALIYDNPTGSAWLVTADMATQETLSIEALNNYPLPQGKSLNLWLEPQNQSPVHLGCLPERIGRYAMPLPEKDRQSINGVSQFVVSMEDVNFGADRPVGQVMWVTPIARRLL